MEELTTATILSRAHIEAAIKQIKKGTVAGQDGFTTDFYAKNSIKTVLLDHLENYSKV